MTGYNPTLAGRKDRFKGDTDLVLSTAFNTLIGCSFTGIVDVLFNF